MTDITITNFMHRFYFSEKQIEQGTQDFYLHKVFKFSVYLCRTAMLSDLCREAVNRYLSYRLSQVAANTVRGDRSTLLAIWMHAFQIEMLDEPPLRVKPIKKVLKTVEGWDQQQRAALLNAINKLNGEFRDKGVGRREFWLAVVLTLYDTGLRLGDLLNLDAAQLRGEGVISVVQRKTKKIVDVQLGPEAWAAIQAIHPRRRKKPFGDVICRHWFFMRFAEICQDAGLDGRTRKLRITCGSEIEKAAPGLGHVALGNGRGVFEKHYLDVRLAKRVVPRPPKFG